MPLLTPSGTIKPLPLSAWHERALAEETLLEKTSRVENVSWKTLLAIRQRYNPSVAF